MKLRYWVIFFLTGVLLSSCSPTRRLQEDEYLLARNRISIEKEEGVSRSEQVSKDDLYEYIRQRPNKRLFGIPFFLHVHNLSKPEKMNWTKRVGEPPVIYDAAQTERSVDALSIYMRGHGFFQSTVDVRIDTLRNRKIRAGYRVKPGPPSRIGAFNYDFQDAFLEPIIQEDSAKTYIRSGDIFNTDVLQDERQRITGDLKRQGFYNFSINSIGYGADTVSQPGVVNLTMRVRQRAAGFNENDEPVTENNRIYRIRNIYIQPDYNPNWAAADSLYKSRLDTVEYRGVNFIYYNKLNILPEVLMRSINIYPNDLYNADNVNRAYDNLMRLNVFRSANILFTELPDSLSGNVSFIGDEGANHYTQEGYLDCAIQCVPGKRQSYSVDLEGSGTSTYYGLLTTFGYQNRNLGKGAESFDFSITTGYEFMRSQGRKNSFEIGGAVGINFPRFVAPFKIDPYNRMNSPRTRLEISTNFQNRPYYTRVLTSANWGYSWRNNGYSSFIFRPLDISIVKANDVDQDFLNGLQNEYLVRSFDSQLLLGISGSYIYNNQARNVNGNAFRFRVNAETNGNLLNLLTPLVVSNSSADYYKVFGIQYAQYVRGDLDMSYKFALGHRTAFAARFYVGAGKTYGNSQNTSIPFERLFYAGGPNSMRGWQARTLGPGSVEHDKPDESGSAAEDPSQTNTYPAYVGNFKLEGNIEFRFPVYKFLNGAVFADLGNIWMVGSRDEKTDPNAYFKFNRFYNQLGLNTGLGARFDFGFFLFRVDWGLRLHDPNKASGQKWIRGLTMRQSTFSFNVGYPF